MLWRGVERSSAWELRGGGATSHWATTDGGSLPESLSLSLGWAAGRQWRGLEEAEGPVASAVQYEATPPEVMPSHELSYQATWIEEQKTPCRVGHGRPKQHGVVVS